MAAASTEAKASSSSAEAADPMRVDPLEGALRAAAVHAAALVLISTAQHLQRTTLLVEAATAKALAQGLVDPDQGEGGGLAVARAALAEAMRLYEAAQAQARTLACERGPT